MSVDMWALVIVNALWLLAAVALVIGVFYGIVHAGKRYPLLGLLVAAVLLAGIVSPLRQEVRR